MFNVSRILNETDHRPWPLPTAPWIMINSWKHLLFAHWPVEAEQLKRFLPEGLELDLWEGQAWLGIVPFEMAYQLRYCPFSIRFGELNVRTYVIHQGKPGVVFLSLDASDLFTVYMARLTYSLPYYSAKIKREKSHSKIYYQSQRNGRQAVFNAAYGPVSEPFTSIKGSFEHWLTERYCLYAQNRSGVLCRGNIHHSTWSLQMAEADIRENTMAKVHGISLPNVSPILHCAKQIDVIIWPLEKVERLIYDQRT